MTTKQKILAGLAVVLVGIQFARPEKNVAPNATKATRTIVQAVPQHIDKILATSCYDCHSNNTVYPWYAEVQPIGWWLDHHIDEGKAELNFDAFQTYSLRRQYHKLEEIVEMVESDEMPLPSYLKIHGDAELKPEQKHVLVLWAQEMQDSLKAHHPMDSLIRKR